MNSLFEKFALDLLNFNKVDDRKTENKERDQFMLLCFKIFIIMILVSILFLLIQKYKC